MNLNYSFGQNTQLGKNKEYNTDVVLDFPIQNGHVFLVCDGHDGDQGHGALAAKLASESIKKYFFNKNYKDTLSALTNAVSFANFSIYEQALKDQKYNNIGSTIAMIIYQRGKVYYAYAGDSRIYLYKNNQLKALTLDHVEDRYNPSKSKVNILLGKEKDIKFGVCKQPLQMEENDRLLICTDGLTDVVSNNEIAEIVEDDNTSPDHKALLLNQIVDEKGGADNASIQVVEFDNNHKIPKATGSAGKKIKLIATIVFVATVIGFGGYKGFEYFSIDKNKQVNAEKESLIKIENELKQKEDKVELAQKEPEKDLDLNSKSEPEKNVKEPVVKEPVEPKETLAPQSTVEQFYSHKVQYGENLYRLSLRYGVSQSKLKALNGDKAINLIAGSLIKVPVRAVHRVQKGESYSVLSDLYNVKIDVICRANKLNKNEPLSEGKMVVVPFK